VKSAGARPQNGSSLGSALRLVGHQAHDCAENLWTGLTANPGYHATGKGSAQYDNGGLAQYMRGWPAFLLLRNARGVDFALTPAWGPVAICWPLFLAQWKTPGRRRAALSSAGSLGGMRNTAGKRPWTMHMPEPKPLVRTRHDHFKSLGLRP